jgi:hypothetical protein
MLQITNQNLINSEVASDGGIGGGQSAPVEPPLTDEAMVLRVALGRVVLAEVNLAAVEGNDGLATRLVEPVRWVTLGRFPHG